MGSALTAAEMKPLTKKERLFVEGIALNGLDRAEAFSAAFDESIEGELYNKILARATRLFYKPHVRAAYDEIMEQVREAETKKAAWNKEVATEKLMGLVKKAEGELETERITMARLTAMTSAIKELNAMHGLNAPSKSELDVNGGLIIIEDKLED